MEYNCSIICMDGTDGSCRIAKGATYIDGTTCGGGGMCMSGVCPKKKRAGVGMVVGVAIGLIVAAIALFTIIRRSRHGSAKKQEKKETKLNKAKSIDMLGVETVFDKGEGSEGKKGATKAQD
jgi:hypothetical protein